MNHFAWEDRRYNARHASTRRGVARVEVVALLLIGLVATTGCLGAMMGAREAGRGNTCRNNLRLTGMGLFNVSVMKGSYPGYSNLLLREDGTPFVDPQTKQETPVSWAVMVLPQLDRMALYDRLRSAQPTADAPTAAFIDMLNCPSDPPSDKNAPGLSYVVNTGMPDLPASVAAEGDKPARPRDLSANGVFFDNYVDFPKSPNEPLDRRRVVIMSDDRIRDPKDKTIMLTENVDATTFVSAPNMTADGNWKAAEVQWGCVWRPGKIDAAKQPPTMTPPIESLRMNVERGRGDGLNYDHSRPSSHHPGGANFCFVGQNVMPLKDTISYFVFAKLMTSDDEGAADPADPATKLDINFRMYQLAEKEINP